MLLKLNVGTIIMKGLHWTGLLVGALAFGISTPALSHHSHAMYESGQITLVGTVKELQWSNPHVFLYVIVRGEDGQTSNWALEGGAPSVLVRQGWPSGNPKPGDEITVNVRPLKAGRGGLIRTVTFADRSEFIYGGGPESSLQNGRPQQQD